MALPHPLSIREITPAEFDLVWPIFRTVIETGDTYALAPSTSFEEARGWWMGLSARVFVAERNGKVVGTSVVKPNQPGLGDHVANAGYMVAPEARGQGIARELCEHSMGEARKAGFTAMQFNYAVSTNEGAVRLWQKCGFTIVGTVPGAFRHAQLGPVDVYVMHRML